MDRRTPIFFRVDIISAFNISNNTHFGYCLIYLNGSARCSYELYVPSDDASRRGSSQTQHFTLASHGVSSSLERPDRSWSRGSGFKSHIWNSDFFRVNVIPTFDTFYRIFKYHSSCKLLDSGTLRSLPMFIR